jgi:hypothetical protein
MFKARAQIVVHRPSTDEGPFRFDLVDLDGPRHGQRLSDREVAGVDGPPGTRRRPDSPKEVSVRSELRRYGERNGYVVVD